MMKEWRGWSKRKKKEMNITKAKTSNKPWNCIYLLSVDVILKRNAPPNREHGLKLI